MGVLTGVLTVLFGILCFLLIIMVLLQTDRSAGMGIFGGSSQSAFGSSTVDVITKITGVMVALFLAGSLSLSVLESYEIKKLEESFKTDTATEKTELKKAEDVKKNDTKATEKKDAE